MKPSAIVSSSVATGGLIALGFGLCLAINLPGHLSFDSVVQLYEGRTGVYGNWHPPMMSWLLGVFDAVVPGTSLFVIFDAALLFGSLGGLLRLQVSFYHNRTRVPPSVAHFVRATFPASGGGKDETNAAVFPPPLAGEVSSGAPATEDGGGASMQQSDTSSVSWFAFLVIALCLLTPQFVLYQGIVWKDVLFADLSVGGFVCLAIAGELWPKRYWRFGLMAKGMLLLVLAALVRQNGAVVLPAGCAALAWFAATQSDRRRVRAAATYGLGTFAAALLAVVLVHSALALRIVGDPSPTVQFRLLQFYDLIGAIKTEPSLALPQFDDDDPALEQAMRTDGVTLYTPQRNDTLAQSTQLQRAYFDSPDETIPAAWRALIVEHPGLYWRIRADVFRWVMLTPDLALCRPIYTGVSGPPDMMQKLGLKTRLDARDLALGNYAKRFAGTPVFSHAAYAVLALCLLVVLFARRRAADIAMAFLLIAAFAFVASFFIISIACDYRYLYFFDLATLVSGFHVALDWRSVLEAVYKSPRAGE
jgi:hypothetical protein